MGRDKRHQSRAKSGLSNAEEKKRRRDAAEAWKNTRGDDPNKPDSLQTSNSRFDAFYSHLLNLSQEEYEVFVSTLRAPLPACFHINPDIPFAEELKDQLHKFAGERIEVDNHVIESVKPLRWYPQECGYQFGTDRRTIRKCAALDGLHKWLMQHTENGNLTRQEAVSMVPPLALNVAPHHKCLDMCAAPGSKTSQLLEIVNRSLCDPPAKQGLVVANDADTDRAYMLVHQCRRINSPLLVITTHPGQMFPRLSGVEQGQTGFFDRVLCDVPCSGDGTLRKNPTIWKKWSLNSSITLHPLQLVIAQRGLQLLKPGGLLVFSTCSMSPYEDEAVVAELLRQHPNLELVDARDFVPLFRCRPGLTNWQVWDDFDAVRKEYQDSVEAARAVKRAKLAAPATDSNQALETTEAQTASDCAEDVNSSSTNEIVEDVAVNLATCEPSEMSSFERCKSLGMIPYNSWQDVPVNLQRKFRASLFPPTPEEIESMHLERCMRCLPHDEDTGGFFVATFRKIDTACKKDDSMVTENVETMKDVVIEDEEAMGVDCCCDDSGSLDQNEASMNEALSTDKASDNNKAPKNKKDGRNLSRGLVDFVPLDASSYEKIREFYGISSDFSSDSLWIREDFGGPVSPSAKSSKSIFYLPAPVQSVVHADIDQKMKIVSAGVKMLEKKVKSGVSSEVVDYRLVQEGLPYIVPYMNRRQILVTIQDFCNLLEGGLVSFSTLSKECLMAIQKQPSGALVCSYQYSNADTIKQEQDDTNQEGIQSEHTDVKGEEIHMTFSIISWKGNTSTLNVMCTKVEMESMKHQLQALKVYRPKISAQRKDSVTPSPSAELSTEIPAESSSTSEVSSENSV